MHRLHVFESATGYIYMPFKLQILKTLILYVSKPYVRGVDKLMSTINQNTQMTQPWE